jgi:outer membrane cobalamin receptor
MEAPKPIKLIKASIMRFLFFLALSMVMFPGCSTTRSTTVDDAMRMERDNATNTVKVGERDASLDLTSYFRQVPGVMVRGSGPTAVIRIRGSISFQGDTTPLFVVNGTILGNSFAQVYSTIDINEIDKVKVLRTVSETSEYGIRGGNGVIEIYLKKK